jgi:hypothetical protein
METNNREENIDERMTKVLIQRIKDFLARTIDRFENQMREFLQVGSDLGGFLFECDPSSTDEDELRLRASQKFPNVKLDIERHVGQSGPGFYCELKRKCQ